MLKLFYIPKTRASRVRWMLEELGEPYELARIDWPHARGAEYRRNVHPLGAVPALQDEGLVVIESAAIIAYLADKFPERGFAPPPQERGPYYQWIVYAMATVEPLVSQLSKDPGSAELQARLSEALRPMDETLRERTFLGGDRISAADIVAGSVLNWAASLKVLGDFPSTQAYVERLRARPAFQTARKD